MRATDIPKIHALYVEKEELMGVSYGSKGIGEITTIPAAPAVAGAYYQRDHVLRNALPMENTAYRHGKKTEEQRKGGEDDSESLTGQEQML